LWVTCAQFCGNLFWVTCAPFCGNLLWVTCAPFCGNLFSFHCLFVSSTGKFQTSRGRSKNPCVILCISRPNSKFCDKQNYMQHKFTNVLP
jgi:hypothetical protein